MPQIPVVNESQAMNVSSPVGIGNADASMPTAINKLGSALENLGAKLEEAQSAQREKAQRNQTDLAVAEYWQSQSDIANGEALSGEDGKPRTGLEAKNYLRVKGKEQREQFIKDSGMDPVSANGFRAKTIEIDNHFTPGIMEKTTKLNNDFAQATRQQSLLKQGNIISTDSSMLGDVLVDIETSVNADKSILNKPAAILKDKAVVFESAIVNNISQNNFKGAKALLDQGMKMGVYEPDEAMKRLSSIETAQYRDNSEYRAQSSARRQVEKESFKKQNATANEEYSVKVQMANSDPAALDVLVSEMQADPRLSPAQKNGAIQSIKKGTGVDVTAVRKANMTRNKLLLNEITPEQARQQIIQMQASGAIDFKKAAALTRSNMVVEEFMASNPGGHKIALSYAKQLEASFTESRNSPNASFSTLDSSVQKTAVQNAFWGEVTERAQKGPISASDYEVIYNKVLSGSGKGAMAPPKPTPGVSQKDFKDLSSASTFMKSLAEKEKLSPPKNREEKKTRMMQKIYGQQMLEILKLREEAKQQPLRVDAPKAASGKRAFDD